MSHRVQLKPRDQRGELENSLNMDGFGILNKLITCSLCLCHPFFGIHNFHAQVGKSRDFMIHPNGWKHLQSSAAWLWQPWGKYEGLCGCDNSGLFVYVYHIYKSWGGLYQISDVVGFSQCFFDVFLYHFKEIPKSNNLKKKEQIYKTKHSERQPWRSCKLPLPLCNKNR